MSKYVDVYLLPIPEENIPAYKKLATKAGKLFVKHGALKYREYVASDLKVQDVVPFQTYQAQGGRDARLCRGRTQFRIAPQQSHEGDLRRS